MTLSVRTKLAAWYVVTVAVLLLLFVGADMIGLRANLIGRIDERLAVAAEGLMRRIGPGAVGPDAVGEIYDLHLRAEHGIAVIVDGGQVAAAVPDRSTDLVAELVDAQRAVAPPHTGEIGGSHRFRVTALAGPGPRRVIVALPMTDAMSTWRQAISEHLILAAVLIAVVSVFGYGVIVWAFRPVRRLTAMVNQITASDLSSRVDAGGDRFEIGQLATTFNQVIARLEDAFARETRFSGDVAHELKTPLAIMRSELELALRRNRPAHEYRQTIVDLGREVGRMSQIVDDLLLLARAEACDVATGLGETSLDEVVVEVYERLAAVADASAVRLELIDVAPVRVHGDPDLLPRLVANILGNAITFSREGGQVDIELAARGDSFELRISDRGVGIERAELDRIFERFYRTDQSRDQRTGGAGLGLAIVAEIARVHAFAIQVDSEPGRGTTFRITGPAAVAAAPSRRIAGT